MSLPPDDAKPALDILRSVGGDEMLAMMMRTFIDFADERMTKMNEAAAAGNVVEVAAIAHSLKSSSRQLGAMPLGESCEAAEKAGKAGDAAGAATAVATAKQDYAAARLWMAAIAGA